MVRHDALGNGGADGVNLGGDTTALDPDADIQVAEFVLSHDQHGFKDLQTQGFRLHVLNGLSIDLDQSSPLLGKGNCSCSLFPGKIKSCVSSF